MPRELDHSNREVVDSIHLEDEFDLLPGQLSSFQQVTTNEYLFLDFKRQMIYHLDRQENTLSELGSHGNGPGEYQVPTHIKAVGDDKVAYTDASEMSVEIINFDGEFEHEFDHQLGGGKNFWARSDTLFLLGGISDPSQEFNQLTAVDLEGEIINEFFPLEKDYESAVRTLGISAITYFNDQIVFMNRVEPVVYAYNPANDKRQSYRPFKTDSIQTGNNPEILKDYTENELRQAYEDDITTFQRMDVLTLNGEDYLAVTARKDEHKSIYFLNRNFDMAYYYYPKKDILGMNDKFIFESDASGGSPTIEFVQLSAPD